MSKSTWRAALFILIITCTSSGNAVDLSRGILFDVPDEIVERQFGKMPLSQLTWKDSLEIASFRLVSDTIKVLAILVHWSNRPATYPAEAFDSMTFLRSVYPSGSVTDYFDEVSYNQGYVTGDLFGWYDAGIYDPYYDFETLIEELDPYIDYSQYDGNHDSLVDAIIFIRSGNGQEDSGDPDDIWSHAFHYHPDWAPGPYDGVKISRWCTSPETMPLRDSVDPHFFSGVDTVNCITVAAHELTHNFGLPDLYDYDSKLDTSTYSTPNDDNDHPVMDWCLMGYNGYGLFSIKKLMPPHLTGWCKKEMGWNIPIELDEPVYNDLLINNIETTNDSSLYVVPIDSTTGEYFLLEYRNPQSNAIFDKLDSDFSVYLWPYLTFGCDTLDRGLLITHVYDSANPYWFSNNGTPDYSHYTVKVVDAGYNPDQDAYSNPEGYVTDSAQWWYPFETRKGALFSDDVPGQEEFGPFTYPGSDGYFSPTGIYIRVDSIIDDKLYAYVVTGADPDGDGIRGVLDNCPDVYNPDQSDADENGVGDICEYICGDANTDDAVNILDITFIIAYLYKDGQPPESMWAADVNGDGAVNILDITYLIAFLYKGGPEPVCL